MPFKKVSDDDYVSPRGNHFNRAQVRLYYANGEKFPGQARSEKMDKFTSRPSAAKYARGGKVLREENSSFMKTPDHFRTDTSEQSYGKRGGSLGSGGRHGPNCSCSACRSRFG